MKTIPLLFIIFLSCSTMQSRLDDYLRPEGPRAQELVNECKGYLKGNVAALESGLLRTFTADQVAEFSALSEIVVREPELVVYPYGPVQPTFWVAYDGNGKVRVGQPQLVHLLPKEVIEYRCADVVSEHFWRSMVSYFIESQHARMGIKSSPPVALTAALGELEFLSSLGRHPNKYARIFIPQAIEQYQNTMFGRLEFFDIADKLRVYEALLAMHKFLQDDPYPILADVAGQLARQNAATLIVLRQ